MSQWKAGELRRRVVGHGDTIPCVSITKPDYAMNIVVESYTASDEQVELAASEMAKLLNRVDRG